MRPVRSVVGRKRASQAPAVVASKTSKKLRLNNKVGFEIMLCMYLQRDKCGLVLK